MMAETARQVELRMLDWLAQHGLDGPTETFDIMQAGQRALAALQQRVEVCEAEHPIEPAWAELPEAALRWAETMDGDRPAYSTQARRLYRTIDALARSEEGKP